MGWRCGRGCRARGGAWSEEAAGRRSAARTPTPTPVRCRGGPGELERDRPARRRAEVRGGLPRDRRAPAVGEGAEGCGRVDEGAHPLGPGAHRAPRLRDRRPVPQGRAVAAGASLPRGARSLLRAALVNYARMYSWEVSRRERVESTGSVDLKAWTREQIYDEAVRAYVDLWKEREALGRESVRRSPSTSSRTTTRGNPADAARRALLLLHGAPGGHLWLEPRAIQRCLRAATSPASPRGREVDGGTAGPARRSGGPPGRAIRRGPRGPRGLARRRGEREAAFEARLERLRRLHTAFTEDDDRDAIERDLEHRLPAMADRPWFAMGQAQLAEFLESGTEEMPSFARARPPKRAGAPTPTPSAGSAAARSSRASRRRATTSMPWRATAPAGVRSWSPTGTSDDSTSAPTRWTCRAPRDDRDNKPAPEGEEVQNILATEARGGVDGRPAGDARLPSAQDLRRPADGGAGPLRGRRLGRLRPRGFPGQRRQLPRHRPRLHGVAALAKARTASAAQRRPRPFGETGRPVPGAAVELLLGDWSPERIQRSPRARRMPRAGWSFVRRRAAPRPAVFFLRAQGRRPCAGSDYALLVGGLASGRDDGVARLHRSQHLPPAAEDPLEGARVPRKRRRGRLSAYSGASMTVTLSTRTTSRFDTERDDQRLRHGRGGVRDPDRPRPRRLARGDVARRSGCLGARRGVQATDLRGEARGPEGAAASQSAGSPRRRSPLLLRAARCIGNRALASDAHSPVSVVVLVARRGGGAKAETVAAGSSASRRTAASRWRSLRRPTSGSQRSAGA